MTIAVGILVPPYRSGTKDPAQHPFQYHHRHNHCHRHRHYRRHHRHHRHQRYHPGPTLHLWSIIASHKDFQYSTVRLCQRCWMINSIETLFNVNEHII